MAGLSVSPPLATAPGDARVDVELVARRYSSRPSSGGRGPSAEEADIGVRRTAALLAAAALPVLATLALGPAVGVAFLVLAAGALLAGRLRPRLLARTRLSASAGGVRRAFGAVAALTALASVVGYPVAVALERAAAAQRQQEMSEAAAAATQRERARAAAERARRAAAERLREEREAAAERRAQVLRRRRARAARLRRERRIAAAQEREAAAAAAAAAQAGAEEAEPEPPATTTTQAPTTPEPATPPG
jgi:hypothetical protein